MLGAGDPHDVWKVVGGYRDVPRAAPWERLRDIALRFGSLPSIARELREIAESREGENREESEQLLELLKAPAASAPWPWPGLVAAVAVVALAGIAAALWIRFRRTRRS